MAKISRRRYTEEFKQEAIKLVIEHSYTQQEAAVSLGIPCKNLNRWVNDKETAEKKSLSVNKKKFVLYKKKCESCSLKRKS